MPMNTRATPCLLALALAFVAFPAFSQCDTIDAYVQVGYSSSEYYSAAVARCYWNGLYGYAFLSIDHTITNGAGSTLYYWSGQSTGYEYSNSTNWFGNPGDCFNTEGDFFISDPAFYPVYYDGTGSGCACIPAPPGGGGCDGQLLNRGEDCSPIVINFSQGPYQLTGADDAVRFDIAGSGTKTRTTWTAAGADEAFLWLDRNHNAVVDSRIELLGNATVLMNGRRAANGFEALKEFDANRDGVINASDPIWGDLMLWRDLNHDGVSQRDEIQPIASSRVAAISLDYHWTGRQDSHGNMFRYESRVWLGSQPRPVYDIFFVPVE
jgi:hypothetical protein